MCDCLNLFLFGTKLASYLISIYISVNVIKVFVYAISDFYYANICSIKILNPIAISISPPTISTLLPSL